MIVHVLFTSLFMSILIMGVRGEGFSSQFCAIVLQKVLCAQSAQFFACSISLVPGYYISLFCLRCTMDSEFWVLSAEISQLSKVPFVQLWVCFSYHLSSHLIYPFCKGHWGTTDDFATSLLHFSQFSTVLWDLATSRPVHSLMLLSHLYHLSPITYH